jgi:hypothetical protein
MPLPNPIKLLSSYFITIRSVAYYPSYFMTLKFLEILSTTFIY